MLGGKVKEPDQAFPGDSRQLDRFGVLGVIVRCETRSYGPAVGAPRGVPLLVESAIGAGLKPPEQLAEHAGELFQRQACSRILGNIWRSAGTPDPQHRR